MSTLSNESGHYVIIFYILPRNVAKHGWCAWKMIGGCKYTTDTQIYLCMFVMKDVKLLINEHPFVMIVIFLANILVFHPRWWKQLLQPFWKFAISCITSQKVISRRTWIRLLIRYEVMVYIALFHKHRLWFSIRWTKFMILNDGLFYISPILVIYIYIYIYIYTVPERGHLCVYRCVIRWQCYEMRYI